LTTRRLASHQPTGELAATEPVVAPIVRQVRRATPVKYERRATLAVTRAALRRCPAEYRTTGSRFRPFTSMRFHVLLNSLFKVLFNFPSRYLFAIGLVEVFSLGWSLPPALGCDLRQPDSTDGHNERPACSVGAYHPLWGPRSRGHRSKRRTPSDHPQHHSSQCRHATRDSVLGSSPFTRRY
jgi:hypothetical protein